MPLRMIVCFLLLTLSATRSAAQQAAEPADLVLVNAKVWTGEPARRVEPQAVAVRGNRIVAVDTNDEVNKLVREGHTRVLDLQGRLVIPGFIDNHTHFAQAGRLLLGLNLLDVNEPEKLRQRVAEAAGRLPAGAWLVGGDWGAYAQWGQGSTGKPAAEA